MVALLHEAGRSTGLPVQFPLRPAPFPPFVGGLGLATAGLAAASAKTLANSKATSFLMSTPPSACLAPQEPPRCEGHALSETVLTERSSGVKSEGRSVQPLSLVGV